MLAFAAAVLPLVAGPLESAYESGGYTNAVRLANQVAGGDLGFPATGTVETVSANFVVALTLALTNEVVLDATIPRIVTYVVPYSATPLTQTNLQGVIASLDRSIVNAAAVGEAQMVTATLSLIRPYIDIVPTYNLNPGVLDLAYHSPASKHAWKMGNRITSYHSLPEAPVGVLLGLIFDPENIPSDGSWSGVGRAYYDSVRQAILTKAKAHIIPWRRAQGLPTVMKENGDNPLEGILDPLIAAVNTNSLIGVEAAVTNIGLACSDVTAQRVACKAAIDAHGSNCMLRVYTPTQGFIDIKTLMDGVPETQTWIDAYNF
jgi:hypothetical protein